MRTLFLTLIMLCTSCVMHTPSTNTRLELGHEDDKGVFLAVKPFDSDKVTGLFVSFYDWLTD